VKCRRHRGDKVDCRRLRAEWQTVDGRRSSTRNVDVSVLDAAPGLG